MRGRVSPQKRFSVEIKGFWILSADMIFGNKKRVEVLLRRHYRTKVVEDRVNRVVPETSLIRSFTWSCHLANEVDYILYSPWNKPDEINIKFQQLLEHTEYGIISSLLRGGRGGHRDGAPHPARAQGPTVPWSGLGYNTNFCYETIEIRKWRMFPLLIHRFYLFLPKKLEI